MSNVLESSLIDRSIAPATGERPLTIAFAGNPNAGKTTLFNALTGLRQKVANYPGVTVERKEGSWLLSPGGSHARVIDLPGLYSLDAAAIDEQIARDVLLGRLPGIPSPNVIVAVVDATNIHRNLYLVTQILEYGRPVVVALTMVDLAARRGIEVDSQRLSDELGVPVVKVSAAQRRGLEELAAAVMKAAKKTVPAVRWRLSEMAERELVTLSEVGSGACRCTALRELYTEELPKDEARSAAVQLARGRLAKANAEWWQEPLRARYRWIEQVAEGVMRNGGSEEGATNRIDRVVTHKIFGPLLLVFIMLLVFQAIFSWASLPMDLIDGSFARLGHGLRSVLPEGLLADLMVDGVIAGVGGVLVFLPQILLLFFFIALLEDSGYMARAAFLLDRLMRAVGLHGKAFVPLLSSFACAIPGIMATRTIENPKDRLATILIAPLMSCSARLPVYTLMIALFFSGQSLFGIISVGALVMMAMYLLGIAVAIGVAWVLKRTLLRGDAPPLVMEMPPYRMPNPLTIMQTTATRGWLFIRRAGTVILAISIILWALVTFPRTETSTTSQRSISATAQALRETGTEAAGESVQEAGIESEEFDESGAQLRNSFAGRMGRFIEPVIAPLGFDWKMGIGLITSFAARETLVSTLGIVYNVGTDSNEESSSLIDAMRNSRRPDGSPAWTPLIAVSMMIFFVLACQCMSTVAIVRRETNSWRWPLFMVAYMLALAYVASFITFQGGRLLGFS
ncbi:MAG: ferrous iron transport protein B [Pyrinomonadaceae bacterium]|nr:ferrous iron transport protein B [Pyrinomonadaceae bacterium]